MLQFYAVLPDFELRHLHVEQSIQADLTDKFRHEAAAFLQNKEAIEFEPGYPTSQRGEVLVLRDFPLPERFQEDVRNSNHCEDIAPQDLSHRNVKAVVGALARDEDGAVEIAVFKEMSGARILDQRAFGFLLDGSTLTPGYIIPAS